MPAWSLGSGEEPLLGYRLQTSPYILTWWKMPGSSLVRLFSSVQSLSCVRLFVIPWTAARHASLSITNSWSLLKLMSIQSVMPSNHLILCCPLLLPPSVFPSIRVFSNESVLSIRWPKYEKHCFYKGTNPIHDGSAPMT